MRRLWFREMTQSDPGTHPLLTTPCCSHVTRTKIQFLQLKSCQWVGRKGHISQQELQGSTNHMRLVWSGKISKRKWDYQMNIFFKNYIFKHHVLRVNHTLLCGLSSLWSVHGSLLMGLLITVSLFFSYPPLSQAIHSHIFNVHFFLNLFLQNVYNFVYGL